MIRARRVRQLQRRREADRAGHQRGRCVCSPPVVRHAGRARDLRDGFACRCIIAHDAGKIIREESIVDVKRAARRGAIAGDDAFAEGSDGGRSGGVVLTPPLTTPAPVLAVLPLMTQLVSVAL